MTTEKGVPTGSLIWVTDAIPLLAQGLPVQAATTASLSADSPTDVLLHSDQPAAATGHTSGNQAFRTLPLPPTVQSYSFPTESSKPKQLLLKSTRRPAL